MPIEFWELLLGLLEKSRTPIVVATMLAIYHYYYHVKPSKN